MDAKKNNHHTLFITLIIALFVLLIVALSKARSYGSELGFNENEVSSNDEINEEITENSEEDSEERIEIPFSETDEENISDSEIVLEERDMLLSANTRGIIETTNRIDSSVKTGWRYSNNVPPALQQHSSSDLYYIYLTAGVTYTISADFVYTCDGLYKSSVCTYYDSSTITPEENCYIVKNNHAFYVEYSSFEEVDDPPIDDPDPSGNDPDPSGNDPDPSGNDPSGNDPSGNDPSGGGIELDGDLQTYLINYFGHKDYTVYDSEEDFKNKKFFVSRYEYEVLKSLDDIKILLLCNVGVLMVILFVGRRKRNASS